MYTYFVRKKKSFRTLKQVYLIHKIIDPINNEIPSLFQWRLGPGRTAEQDPQRTERHPVSRVQLLRLAATAGSRLLGDTVSAL